MAHVHVNRACGLRRATHDRPLDLLEFKRLFAAPDARVPPRSTIRCGVCARTATTVSGSLIACSHCGCVLVLHAIDELPEYRHHSDDKKDSTRCGPPAHALLPNASTGSWIKVKYGAPFELRRAAGWTACGGRPAYRERSLCKVFDRIQACTTIAGGVSAALVRSAETLYFWASRNTVTRALPRQGLIAACLWAACNAGRVPRSTADVAGIFGLDLPTVNRACKRLVEMGDAVEDLEAVVGASTGPLDFCARTCAAARFDDLALALTRDVVRRVHERDLLPGVLPQNVAAACAFFVSEVCKMNLSVDVFCLAAGRASRAKITKLQRVLHAARADILTRDEIYNHTVV